MNLLMVSGDRQVVLGEKGPFHSMQREFSRYFGRIDVLCPRPAGTIRTRTIHGNVHFHPAECGRLGMVGYIKATGARLLRTHAAQLIVSHDYGWFYNGLASAQLSRSSGVPYLSEIHHVPGVPIASGLRERLDRAIAHRYISWAADRAIGFRVVNKVEMPALLGRWNVPLDKVLVLPSLYIDLDVFHPAVADTEARYDLMFVGRMVANKGIDRIIESVAALAKRGIRLRALFVGKGPLAEPMRARAHGLGIGDLCEFVPWVETPEELADLYRASRVCVCASTCEGGPRFTVEAMACGTPVVSTPVGVMGDLLGDGKAGAVAGFDVAGLVDSLERVLGNEEQRRAMGAHAVEIARPFEYARAIAVYANGLRKLVGEPESTP
ncbi:MAG: glycosyltransferase involved in cell wall biosynthesis [Chlamydiales bacterium]|jgi:glycosyltransferase involved in cell wall biosynthesis